MRNVPRLLLTATPVPNEMKEYYELIDLARPGRLGTWLDFRDDIAAPLLAERSTPEAQDDAEMAAEWVDRAGRDLGYFAERRDARLAECRGGAGEAWGRVWREEVWRAGVNERAWRTEVDRLSVCF